MTRFLATQGLHSKGETLCFAENAVVRDIKNNKNKHGMGRAIFGIMMGAIFSIRSIYLLLDKHTSFLDTTVFGE